MNKEKKLLERFKKYNWKECKLLGKVKSVTTIKHNLIENFSELVEDNNIYELNKNEYISFNTRGNVIESSAYDNRGIRTVLLIPSYNSKGQLSDYNYYDNNDNLMSQCLFEHLKDGNTIEEWIDGKTVIEYHLRKNIIEQLSYDIEDNLVCRDTYKYDKEGNLIEFCNDLGKTNYIIDLMGNEIEKTQFDLDGSLCEQKKYKYKLDENKNWIEKNEFLIENNSEIHKTIFEREIIYYE